MVIVGLLIAGIMLATDIVEATEAQILVREIQEMDMAAANFKEKYGYLGGDSPLHTPAGNGDGQIIGTATTNDTFDGEVSNYWRHLSEFGYQPDGVIYSNDATTSFKPGIHIPKLSYGRDVGAIVGSGDGSTPFPGSVYYFITQYKFYSSTYFSALHPFSAVMAQAIDEKMDDGLANSGNVVAQGVGLVSTISDTTAAPDATAGTGCVDNGDASIYQVTSTNERACTLAVRLMSQVKE